MIQVQARGVATPRSGHRAIAARGHGGREQQARTTARASQAPWWGGCQAIADAVALCRPDVVAICPVPPQATILTSLAALAQAGGLGPCRFTSPDSEFAAMSAAMAEAGSGALVYTATASRGLLSASEAVLGSADLRLPIVMTFAGTPVPAALGAAGWIRLHATAVHQMAGLHVQAFGLARELSKPVLVAVPAELTGPATQGPLDPTLTAGV